MDLDWQSVWPLFQTLIRLLTHLPLNKMAAILPDNILKYIFKNEKFYILMKISLKFVPKGPIDNMSALIQVMAWCRTGSKPLLPSSLMHICGTRGWGWGWGVGGGGGGGGGWGGGGGGGVNSRWLCDPIRHQASLQTLVQAMACHLFFETCWLAVNSTWRNKLWSCRAPSHYLNQRLWWCHWASMS